MTMVSGSFMHIYESLRKARAQVQDMQMGQMDTYKAMQAPMQNQHSQYMDNALLAQQLSQLGNGFGQLGIAKGQIFNCSCCNPNCNQEPIYPGQVFYPDGYRRAFPNDREIQELAIMHDFTYKFDADYFLHKNGGTVCRRQLEDCNRSDLPKLFIKAKTPNISWLEDRVNEVRIKLC